MIAIDRSGRCGCRIGLLAGLAALLLCLVADRLSAADRTGETARVALLPTNDSQAAGLAALLEARLTAAGKVARVERQRLDEILKELQLQNVLEADGFAGRASLGKLLQAELLVFIVPQEKPEPHLQITIAETRQGLRLLRQTTSLQDLESTAAAIEKLIDAAVVRQSQPIRAIFAVPAFVSDDLGFAFDHLRMAYPKLIEALLNEQPGVRVVELEEARAIAKEILLTSGADARRSLTLYVLGKYRNDMAGDVRRVRVTLQLMRGEEQLELVERQDLLPDDVPKLLLETTNTFLTKYLDHASPAADPALEGKQLADRCRLQFSLGAWREALDLAEASLLLQPDQPDIHRDAFVSIQHFINAPAWTMHIPLVEKPPADSRLDYYRRGLEHLEPYLRGSQINERRDGRMIRQFVRSIDDWGREKWFESIERKETTPEYQAYWDARAAATLMLLRVLDAKADRKTVDETAWLLGSFDFWWGADRARMSELRKQVLARFVYLPTEGELLENFSSAIAPAKDDPIEYYLQPEYSDFLRRVRQLPNEQLRQRADEMLQRVDIIRQREAAEAEAGKRQVDARPVEAAPDDELVFCRLELTLGNLAESDSLLPMSGCLPAGEGIDMFWNRRGIYLMNKPGLLKRIDDRDLDTYDFPEIRSSFDGRYVWSTQGNRFYVGRQEKLLVIDPSTGRVVTLGAEHGLPDCTRLAAVPLGPGRAFVVGYLGRTFAAIVDFESASNVKVKTLREFRKVARTDDPEQWRDADVIFDPGLLHVLSEPQADGSIKQAVLVGRDRPEEIRTHPIVIDASTGEVRVLEQVFFHSDRHHYCGHDGICDVFVFGPDPNKYFLRRVGVNAVSERPLDRAYWNPRLIEYDGLLHWFEPNGWSIGDKHEGPFKALKCHMPHWSHFVSNIGVSQHLGVLFFVDMKTTSGRNNQVNVYQAKFSRPVAELLSRP